MSDPTRFSPTALATHLACAHVTQLERLRRSGALKVELLPDPRAEALQARGLQHEASYVETLQRSGRTVCDLTGSRDPDATIKAMREGYGIIVQAPLASETLFGIADVLLRCEEPSKLGAYSYEPVDTKLSRETRATSLLQLAAYCDLLTPVLGCLPQRFHVVTPLAQETYRVAELSAYFRLVRRNFETAASASPAPVTYPDPVDHCDVCRYWKHCDDRRRADDHPSLIAGIRQANVREFQAQGIPTVGEIARRDGVLPQRPKRGRLEIYRGLGRQARLQVEARSVLPPPLEHLPFEPGKGLARLPEPSLGDIFLDFEGDPFVGEGGLEYLTGFHVRDKKGAVVLEQLWSLDRRAEKAACEGFMTFATKRWKAHPGMHIYHFGAYEPATLKRLCARHETSGEALDRLLRGERFIDLHRVVREAMCIGIERYGLKELEAVHDFKRTQDLREAGASRMEVEIALELGDRAAITTELCDRIACYNAEDCLSTEALRTWLESQRAILVAQGIPIQRQTTKSPDASEQVGERDERISSLKARLLASVPDDDQAWSEEDRAKALLASMLGYFRQEEKNVWWEHFRLRDLPDDEQFEEREVLGGLEYVETIPKQGKQRNERRRYRFPAQECAIKLGDKVYFPRREDPDPESVAGTTLKVEEIDLPSRSVVLSGKLQRDPTCILADQKGPGVAVLENALLAFAEVVCERGFAIDGAFAGTAALLLRRVPKPPSAHRASLRAPTETTIAAALRITRALCCEVLPIQGPPGAGKTYTGARMILDLARAGKRIGVTAVSHKVIDNLLCAVQQAATEADVTVRLMHKDDGDPPTGVEYINDAAGAVAALDAGAVVGGTAWLWADDRAAKRLDYLFIDEAGQMSLANALAVSRAARNVILLGDPQQLEQPQRGAHPEGADVAALVHLVGKDRKTVAEDEGLFLDATYRLHPAICAYTSEVFYESRLLPAPGLDVQRIKGSSPFAGAGLFLVPIGHEGNQAVAPEEVEAVVRVAESLLQPSARWIDAKGTRPLKPDDILVVAPYNAQVSALKIRLATLGIQHVGTVDRFQGQEAPVVIYSCTSSSPADAPRGMTFLYDPHRFNVATSRAQAVVIVVANPALFEPVCRTPEQMRWANVLCRFREIATIVEI